MRPGRIVLVVGTGTDVGKTWVAARLLTTLRAAGTIVAARKPVQSFEPSDAPEGRDAAILGAATGEAPESVCRPSRCYEAAMAPPMASDLLGRGSFTIADLIEELEWPSTPTQVGLVEAVGGVRSPLAYDGDTVTLAAALAPDVIVLVADAGLGTLNAVRLSIDALPSGTPTVVVLNRFAESNDLHVRNRRWLSEQDGLTVVVLPGEEPALAEFVHAKEGP